MASNLPINWGLVSHWQNWARVLLMVVIGAILMDLLFTNLRFQRKDN